MTHRDYVLAAINHEDADRVPYMLGFEGGTDKELDAYHGSTEWRKKVQPYMMSVGGVDTLAEEKIDETFARDGFGSLWRMDRRPWHLEKPILSEPSLEGLDWPEPERFACTSRDDLDQCTGPNAEKFSICSIGWGLFEQSWRIRGFQEVMMDSVMEPDFYEELLDRLTDLYLKHVERCKDIPADAIQFGDDWGEQRGVTLGPDRWRKFIKPRWAKIYEAVHAQGKYVMSHSCGSVADIMPDIIEIGMDVLESVQPEPAGMESFGLKKKYGDKITFWGCLGSQSTIPFGTPQEIHERVDSLCREMGRGGGFILAPAKSIQPGTLPENSAAVVEAFAKQNLPEG